MSNTPRIIHVRNTLERFVDRGQPWACCPVRMIVRDSCFDRATVCEAAEWFGCGRRRHLAEVQGRSRSLRGCVDWSG